MTIISDLSYSNALIKLRIVIIYIICHLTTNKRSDRNRCSMNNNILRKNGTILAKSQSPQHFRLSVALFLEETVSPYLTIKTTIRTTKEDY